MQQIHLYHGAPQTKTPHDYMGRIRIKFINYKVLELSKTNVNYKMRSAVIHCPNVPPYHQ